MFWFYLCRIGNEVGNGTEDVVCVLYLPKKGRFGTGDVVFVPNLPKKGRYGTEDVVFVLYLP
ncbi:hypothetical protein GCM10008967_40870 [Bacillus carboniphilus]|uniref:Uncharacterized protein n=1 Tax=Bacillus carboniphilus TaxID=86663 RepID=A0ABN0WTC3_9BACI